MILGGFEEGVGQHLYEFDDYRFQSDASFQYLGAIVNEDLNQEERNEATVATVAPNEPKEGSSEPMDIIEPMTMINESVKE